MPEIVRLNFRIFTSLFLALCMASAAFADDIERQKLEVITSAGTFAFQIELADEPHERQQGLMHRTEMDPKHGMLFDFGAQQPVAMWMKNTPLPLDMVFIRSDRTIARIAARTTPFSEAIISSGEPVAYVLEVNAGIMALIGAKPGDRISW